MQENFRLLKNVLEKLHKAACLEHVILIGSWASHLYERYYDSDEYRRVTRVAIRVLQGRIVVLMAIIAQRRHMETSQRERCR